MKELKVLLKKHHGATPVIVYNEQSEKSLLLPNEFNVNITEGSMAELRELLGIPNVVLKK
jgi:DNA polymerase-3 subunit alpha